ncbi:uncharacterized protein BYT42DRAFT_490931 [Radiomyces spectabilis]|uniref:uncharacterized protein n=1 Tax=Radiomyces spectabilis TaxID=64574 RepID=UPI00221F4DF4|nr:uncharacterized protein BYT42DRAFT_490931 [Radiomyces spectabilis]KAI8388769.1 hypothetical protein BYT42DRAFT_490931 [Radiomyces spectabilis]
MPFHCLHLLSVVCPATCELCGHWMPQHSGNCPRNGVHPSQWSMDAITDNQTCRDNDLSRDTAHTSCTNHYPDVAYHQSE